MLLRFFKQILPACIASIILILCTLWIPAILHPVKITTVGQFHPQMPLFGLLSGISGQNGAIEIIITILIMVIIIGILIYFNTKDFFINQRTFLPALFYVLLNSTLSSNQFLSPVLPASLFLMLAIIRIMDSFKEQGIAYNYFDAAILIGIGSLFYANLIWFGIILFVGIFFLRTANIWEMVISVLGMVAPYAITTAILYLLDKNISVFYENLRINLFSDSIFVGGPIPLVSKISLILFGSVILISIFDLFGKINMKTNRSRNSFYLFFMVFIISVFLVAVSRTASFEIMWLVSLPFSFFLGHYFLFTKRKLLPQIFFYGLLISTLAVQIFSVLSYH